MLADVGKLLLIMLAGALVLFGVVIPRWDGADQIALTNSVASIGAGNYDTFHSPRGATFTADGDIAIVVLVASGTGDIGYGDDAVSNSATPPTAAVTVCSFIGGGAAYCPIPSGKLPWVRVDGEGSVQAVGVME